MFTPAMYELVRVRNFLGHIITNSTSAGKAKRAELKGALENCGMLFTEREKEVMKATENSVRWECKGLLGEVEKLKRALEERGIGGSVEDGADGQGKEDAKTKDQETTKVEEPGVLTLVCSCMDCNGC